MNGHHGLGSQLEQMKAIIKKAMDTRYRGLMLFSNTQTMENFLTSMVVPLRYLNAKYNKPQTKIIFPSGAELLLLVVSSPDSLHRINGLELSDWDYDDERLNLSAADIAWMNARVRR